MFRLASNLTRSRAPGALQNRAAASASLSTLLSDQRQQLIRHSARSGAFSRARRFAHSGSTIDREAEHKRAKEKLEADPSKIEAETKTLNDLEFPVSAPAGGVTSDITQDLKLVKDTFRLDKTPRESHILGLMGTVPYFATSISSVFLSWNLTMDYPTASAFYNAILLNHETAQKLLDFIEPLQLGYGAVIISFLGAIHWGLEYAEKKPNPERTRFRYGMGVVAPILAWPTLLMPLEYGLITQFGAFVALYFADSRASMRGWAPQWYGHYRFLLTAMVGLALFISLVGRSRIETSQRLSGNYLSEAMKSPGMADTTTNWAKAEAEEKERLKKEKEEKEKKEKEKKEKEKKEKEKKEKEEKEKKQQDKQPKKKKDDKDDKDDKGSQAEKNSDDDKSKAKESKSDESSKKPNPKKDGEDDETDGGKADAGKAEAEKSGDEKSKDGKEQEGKEETTQDEGKEQESQKEDGDKDDKAQSSEKDEGKSKSKKKDE